MLDLFNKGAFLFDCDGTITDEEFLPEIVARTIHEICNENGITFNRDTFDEVFKANKGGGFDKYYLGYLNAIERADVLNTTPIPEFSERSIAKYTATAERIANGDDVGIRFNINEDAVKMIRWANEQGIPVVIVTNADPRILAANLKMAGIGVVGEMDEQQIYTAFADGVVNRSHYGEGAEYRKPHSYPFEKGAEVASTFDRPVSLEHCVGYEDSLNGHLSMTRAKVRLRIHVCEKESEAVAFVKDGEKCRPHAIAPHGQLTPEFITDAIDQFNNTGKVKNLVSFEIAANDDRPGTQKPQRAATIDDPRMAGQAPG